MLLADRGGDRAGAQRRLIAAKPVAMPGVFNAPVGMLAQQLGFEAVYVSGAGLINGTAGYPDIGLLGMDEVARQAGYIAQSIAVPAICDAATGFGDVLQVMRTVQAFERAGVAGLRPGARVHYDHLRALVVGRDLVSFALQLAEDTLGIDERLGATQADKSHLAHR